MGTVGTVNTVGTVGTVSTVGTNINQCYCNVVAPYVTESW